MNVQVLADPAGRLIWVSPALPGARHDIAAAREHGIIVALPPRRSMCWPTGATKAPGRHSPVPQRPRRKDPDTGKYRPLSHVQKDVNTAHARLRGPGERANAQLKTWKILRKIRTTPAGATILERLSASHTAGAPLGRHDLILSRSRRYVGVHRYELPQVKAARDPR